MRWKKRNEPPTTNPQVERFQDLATDAVAAFEYIAIRDRFDKHEVIARDAEVFALMGKLQDFGVNARFEANPGSSVLIAFIVPPIFSGQ